MPLDSQEVSFPTKLVNEMHSNLSPFSLEYDMETTFDIFARLPDGKPIWMESVEGLAKTNTRVRELTLIAPNDYFVYSEQSGSIEPV